MKNQVRKHSSYKACEYSRLRKNGFSDAEVLEIWDREIEIAIEAIAKTELGLETLTPQGHDNEDFHEVGVRSIAAALKAAFEAGRNAGK